MLAIPKNKVTLWINKPEYVGICILELSNIIMHEFHYDYIKNKYSNETRLLFTESDSLMWKIKTEMFDFSNFSAKSKYYDNSNTLVVGKIKDEAAKLPIKDFVGLKPKIQLFLLDDSSEHKKSKSVTKNNKIVTANNKISLSCLDDKIHIVDNGFDTLALDSV